MILDELPVCQQTSMENTTASISTSMETTNINEQNILTPRKRKMLSLLNHSMLVSKERKRKLLLAQRKVLRREKKLASMKNIISQLKKKNLLQDEYLEQLEELSRADGTHHEFFLRQLHKEKGKSLPKSYSKALKTFALTLHYYSPATDEVLILACKV